MSEEANQPMSEDTQEDNQRRCAVCYHYFPKDEMTRMQIDEPGAYDWVCAGCAEKVESDPTDEPHQETV